MGKRSTPVVEPLDITEAERFELLRARALAIKHTGAACIGRVRGVVVSIQTADVGSNRTWFQMRAVVVPVGRTVVSDDSHRIAQAIELVMQNQPDEPAHGYEREGAIVCTWHEPRR